VPAHGRKANCGISVEDIRAVEELLDGIRADGVRELTERECPQPTQPF
jgi:hypothetical protein